MMLGSSTSTRGLRGDLLVLFSTSQNKNLAVRAANGPSSNLNGESFNSNSVEGKPNANVPTTRFVRSRKKKSLQWSNGTAPGEYGGPPTYINPRKYWGDVSDPITNRNDFIWNKEWLDRVHDVPAEPSQVQSPKQEQEVGFLSLNRAMALNSLEVDLTQDLMEPSKSVLEQQVEAARLGLPTDEAITTDKPRWRVISTRREQQQWDRATKATTGGTGQLLRNLNKSREDPAVLAAQSKQQYIQLKQRLQLITLGLGGLGTVSAYISYSPEVAASFGAGLLGSLAYIRMLGNSVDSYGEEGVQGTVRGALGQPRLLVPVVLVMMYNRWNENCKIFTMSRNTRSKTAHRDLLIKDPNFGILSDTSEKVTETYQVDWSKIYAIFDNGDVSHIKNDKPMYERIRASQIHAIAARPTVLPYTDAVKWIIENASVKDRGFNDSTGVQLTHFRPKVFVRAFALKPPKHVSI